MKKLKTIIGSLCLLFASPARGEVYFVADLAGLGCVDGSPREATVIDGTDATDCSTGLGTTEVKCLCLDGAWIGVATGSGGGGGGYTTCQEEGSSLTQRSTINFVGSSITCADAGGKTVCTLTDATGQSITLDLGDDGGNDSTALAEVAPVNDYYGVLTEPSADKLEIDLGKIVPPGLDATSEPAPTWECEFDGDICSGTMVGLGTTSNPVSGTLDPLATVTGDPLYSYTYRDGQLCLQSDESSGQTIALYWARTPDTDATMLVRFFWQSRGQGAGEGNPQIGYFLSADRTCTSNCAEADLFTGGGTAGYQPRVYVRNTGTYSIVAGSTMENRTFNPTSGWLVLWKDSNVYRYGTFYDRDELVTPSETTVTKTGTTTFEELHVRIATANDLPSLIFCVDYIKYWDAIVTEFY